MTMRRPFCALLLLLICAPAWAFRARPISDLRFAGAGEGDNAGFMASDGKDFLFLSQSNRDYRDERTYAQRIVDGRAVGPRLEIGRGTPAGIAWTGSEYLAAWSAADGLRTARISRMGALIARSAAPVGSAPGWFASNGRTALAVTRVDANTLAAQPLDLAGQPAGERVTFAMPKDERLDVGPTADGYAVVSTGYRSTLLMLLASNGRPLTDSAITIDGPYSGGTFLSAGASIATDGTDTLILLTLETLGFNSQMRAVVIGPGGTIKAASRILFTVFSAAYRPLQVAGLVWTGDQYLVAAGIMKDPTPSAAVIDPGLLRISRA
jgi:hypothetical protein